MPQPLTLILQALGHVDEHCDPVVHIVIELVVGPVVALLVVLYFRGGENWKKELPEYLVGALLSGI